MWDLSLSLESNIDNIGLEDFFIEDPSVNVSLFQKSDNVIPHSTPPSVPGKFASLIEACGLEARAIPS